MFCRIVAAWLFASMTVVSAAAQESMELSSPDGTVHIVAGLTYPAVAGSRFHFSVEMDGDPVLLDAGFGLAFVEQPPFGENLSITHADRSSADETWQRVYGKRSTVRNHYNELTVTVREGFGSRRSVDLVFRAYDDGVAFRYVLGADWGDFKLTSENTSFTFPGNPVVWAADFGGFVSSQETEFRRLRLSELNPRAVYGCPLLVQVGPEIWTAVSEANLSDWAGMHLTPSAGDRRAVVTALSPLPRAPGVVVGSTAPRTSPWRVLMLGRRPGDLVESDLIQNLNDPPEGDFSWVAPGKSSWDRWWSNGYAPETDFDVGVDLRSMKYFVDLAAEMGWKYQLVDEGWYGSSAVEGTRERHPVSSILTYIPELNIEELVRYAGEKGVDVLLWMNWVSADQEMEEAFPLFEKWGVKGVKIDFMNRDDQEMVEFYHRAVKTAAEHHLVVDFHGAYKPTGWSRTYPNLITREGVMGNEYNKWSDRVTPGHMTTIPFTRGLLGGMDVTPGGFLNRTPETFVPRNTAPFVMGTRAYQLAMLVVYESALQVLTDSPYNYHSSPAGTDFLKIVPTTWDDTHVVDGYPGQFITVARKSGDEWYVGSMTNWTGRTLEIPLDFLGEGTFRAEIWADAYEAADFPDRLMKEERTVTASDTLTAELAPGGGHVVHLVPAN